MGAKSCPVGRNGKKETFAMALEMLRRKVKPFEQMVREFIQQGNSSGTESELHQSLLGLLHGEIWSSRVLAEAINLAI